MSKNQNINNSEILNNEFKDKGIKISVMASNKSVINVVRSKSDKFESFVRYYVKLKFNGTYIYTKTFTEPGVELACVQILRDIKNYVPLIEGSNDINGNFHEMVFQQINNKLCYENESAVVCDNKEFERLISDIRKAYTDLFEFIDDLENIDLTKLDPLKLSGIL